MSLLQRARTWQLMLTFFFPLFAPYLVARQLWRKPPVGGLSNVLPQMLRQTAVLVQVVLHTMLVTPSFLCSTGLCCAKHSLTEVMTSLSTLENLRSYLFTFTLADHRCASASLALCRHVYDVPLAR